MRTTYFDARAVNQPGGLTENASNALLQSLKSYFDSRDRREQMAQQRAQNDRNARRQDYQEALSAASQFGARGPAETNDTWLPEHQRSAIEAARIMHDRQVQRQEEERVRQAAREELQMKDLQDKRLEEGREMPDYSEEQHLRNQDMEEQVPGITGATSRSMPYFGDFVTDTPSPEQLRQHNIYQRGAEARESANTDTELNRQYRQALIDASEVKAGASAGQPQMHDFNLDRLDNRIKNEAVAKGIAKYVAEVDGFGKPTGKNTFQITDPGAYNTLQGEAYKEFGLSPIGQRLPPESAEDTQQVLDEKNKNYQDDAFRDKAVPAEVAEGGEADVPAPSLASMIAPQAQGAPVPQAAAPVDPQIAALQQRMRMTGLGPQPALDAAPAIQSANQGIKLPSGWSFTPQEFEVLKQDTPERTAYIQRLMQKYTPQQMAMLKADLKRQGIK